MSERAKGRSDSSGRPRVRRGRAITRREQLEEQEVYESSTAFKSAVQASLLLGVPAEQVAQQYGLVVSEVRAWAKSFDITHPLKRRDDLSESLMVFVKQELLALTAISVATMDDEWIKAQSASELALFVGAKQDRLMEILSAYGKAEQSRRQIIESQIIDDD